MPNFARFAENPEEMCVVVAFDPGETTGFCVMGVPEEYLLNTREVPLYRAVREYGHIEYGQIDCRTGASSIGDFENQMLRHAGIGMKGEALGVEKMTMIAGFYRNSAIVLEDFIVDMRKIDQARHTLSPVRIISAFVYGMHQISGDSIYRRAHIQSRSLAKTTCTDDRLKAWGLYDRNSGDHARDATRHAFYFLRDCSGSEVKAAEKRWMAWPDRFEDPWAADRNKKKERASKEKPVGDRVFIK